MCCIPWLLVLQFFLVTPYWEYWVIFLLEHPPPKALVVGLNLCSRLYPPIIVSQSSTVREPLRGCYSVEPLGTTEIAYQVPVENHREPLCPLVGTPSPYCDLLGLGLETASHPVNSLLQVQRRQPHPNPGGLTKSQDAGQGCELQHRHLCNCASVLTGQSQTTVCQGLEHKLPQGHQ